MKPRRYTESINTPFGPYQFESNPGYLSGETVLAVLRDLEGAALGEARLRTVRSPGSGFAGQVWLAEVLEDATRRLPTTGRVAIKVLRPRSSWKNAVREGLFLLCFQTRFSPRLRETALRSGLICQELLRQAAEVELGPGSVARPYGYYWDDRLASFVEVTEWVQGRPVRLEADDGLLIRGGRTPAEAARLKEFMDRLAQLCRRIGAVGLARQYDWFTFVSQSNVLVRTQPPFGFCAVDCRPGLAFPFFLPLSPSHVRIALEGLALGRLAHYAEVDLEQVTNLADSDSPWDKPARRLAGGLPEIERAWRDALPDLWNRGAEWMTHKERRERCRTVLRQDWHKMGWTPDDSGMQAASAPLGLDAILSGLPPLLRLRRHPGYRAHLGSFWRHAAYRREALAAWTRRDLALWQDEGRVPPGYASRDTLFQRLLLAPLPPAWHRFCVDPAARKQTLDLALAEPLRLLFSRPARESWLENALRTACRRGAAGEEKESALVAQLHEDRLQGLVRDLGILFGLDLFSRLVYLGLTLYGLRSGNFIPLGVAAFSPVPPSGPLRLLYALVRFLLDMPALIRAPRGRERRRMLVGKLAGLCIAPLRWVGNFYPLIELSAVYPRLAFLLGEHFVSRTAQAIPILGGQGKLLEIWIFQACFNFPLSLHRWITTRPARRPGK